MADGLRHLLVEEGVDYLHSWRCNHPDIYGDCACVDELVAAVLASDWLRGVRAAVLESAADTVGPRLAGAGWLRELATGIRKEGNHD